MRAKAKQFITNPLISGSAVMFIGSILGNVFNFLFNIFMSRNLSVVDYGVLISLLALASFPIYLFYSIVPTTVNFATIFIINSETGKLRSLYVKIIKIVVFSGLIIILIFTLFANIIAGFIHIQNVYYFIVLAGFIALTSLVVQVNMAFLQAKLFFKYSSFVTFLVGFLKFIFGMSLVFFGFKVGGVLIGIIMATTFAYFIGIIPLQFIFKKSNDNLHISVREILSYGAPATIAFLSTASFINTDIILVKHFFSPQEAGLYAGLSLIGKVIFYFSAPIGLVMFPLVVKKHIKGENVNRMLVASLGLVLIPSLSLTLFYFTFPELTVTFFLKKEEYLLIADYVWLFGIFMTLYALLHILVSFYLSIKNTKVYIPIILGALLQIILIYLYHETFVQIIIISISITFLLVTGLLLYYFHATKK